jgi:Spy/CpxP family protein refolding chaperone
MRTVKSLFFAMSIVVSSAVVGAAQVIITVQPKVQQQTGRQNDDRDYTALVREVFAPITDELKLTSEQKFRIVAIVTGTVIRAEPLMDKLDQLDDQLNEATLLYPVDEARIRQLSTQEAEVMGQVVEMKARAKVSMYQVLTPQQRMLVADQFRTRPQVEGSLGSISN